jgi:hypothetical protein
MRQNPCLPFGFTVGLNWFLLRAVWKKITWSMRKCCEPLGLFKRWYFLKEYKIKSVPTFWMCADSFQTFWIAYFVIYIVLNFLRASMKLLTNTKNPSDDLKWRHPPAVLKYYTESRLGHVHLHGFFLHPIGENRPVTDREASAENYIMRLPDQFL